MWEVIFSPFVFLQPQIWGVGKGRVQEYRGLGGLHGINSCHQGQPSSLAKCPWGVSQSKDRRMARMGKGLAPEEEVFSVSLK